MKNKKILSMIRILFILSFVSFCLLSFAQQSKLYIPKNVIVQSSTLSKQKSFIPNNVNNSGVANPSRRTCGTVEVMNRLKQEDPAYEQRIQQMESLVQHMISNPNFRTNNSAVITIPVVFHVVYNNSTENISDAQILSQITVLNEDFRRKNSDTTNTPNEFKTATADAQIEFCLAQQDPSGNVTSGITRTSTTYGAFSTNDDVMFTSKGGKDAWNRNYYLNIWVCRLDPTLLGYAQFPGGPASTDGVVIGYEYIGRTPSNPFGTPYNLGRTATHEVGHWFGLYHIWGDDGGTCTGTDNVNDTPNSADSYGGCPVHPQVSCGSNDMFMNYMDYVDDNCMNIFSAGQAARMLSFINSSRASLKTSNKCTPAVAPVANFAANATIVAPGTTVSFTDSSTNSPTSWSWIFGDGNTSTAKNPSNTYVSVGTYTVSLTATNAIGSDIETKTNYITVKVFPPVADFSASAVGLSVDFTDLTANVPTAWSWSFGDGTTSTIQNPSHTFAKDSAYNVCLIAVNSAGSDTMCKIVTVGIAQCDLILSDPVNNATGYQLFASTNGGFLIGTNGYGDLEKGICYIPPGPGVVTEVWVNFGAKEKVGPADTYQARIYNDANANNLPDGASIGTTTFTTDSVDTSNAWTIIKFGTPVPISGGFCIGIEVDNVTNNDTLGIVHNKAGDGKGLKKSWERWSDNTLKPINDPLTWELDADAIILPVINYGPSPVATIAKTDVICSGNSNGSANLTVTFGTAPYFYRWSNGATTEDIAGLIPGTYYVTVLDFNGCNTTASTTINDGIAYSASTAGINVSCNGGSDGMVDLSVTGGVTPYSYLWSNSATTQDIANLTIGTYIATVTDANGCKKSTSVTVTQPTALALNIIATNINCNGSNNGSADLTVSGGISPYFYSWSNVSNIEDQFGLTAGTFAVTVTDANGCKAGASTTITEPPLLEIILTPAHVTCNGLSNGSVSSNVSGGTLSYTYLWSNGSTVSGLSNINGGTYTLTVTDNKGCKINNSSIVNEPAALTLVTGKTDATCGINDGTASVTATGGTLPYSYSWSNNSTTQSLSNLASGAYGITVTDANACKSITAITIIEPGAPTLSTSVTNALCNGENNGSINLNVSGGTSPFTYLWSNAATTQNIQNLAAGTYIVTVTDAGSCRAISSAVVNEPSVLTIDNITSNNVACNGGSNGSALVSVSGGTAAYSYLWSNGSNGSSANNLSSGSYSVSVTDANGCLESSSVNITEPVALLITIISTDAGCGLSDGALSANVSGGTPSYTYLWSNGNTASVITGLSTGTYKITVKDANGCMTISTQNVSEAGAPVTTHISTDLKCNGDANGSIDLSVTGGTAPYTYSWSNGSNTQDLSGLSGGTYVVTVTGSDGCKTVESIIVNEPSEIAITPSVVDATCNGINDGIISTVVMGGIPSYTYLWSTGQTTTSISNLSVGSHIVTVFDSKGCKAFKAIAVNETNGLNLYFSTVPANVGSSDGSASVSIGGGTAPYSYSWSTGSSNAAINNLSAATYTVTVVDTKGCFAIDTVNVSETIGIADYNTIHSISIYPNPTKGELIISAKLNDPAILNISLYNILGEKIAQWIFNEVSSKELKINLSVYDDGLYFIQIRMKDEVITKRITLMKN